MIVILDKIDLMNLVKGTSPSSDLLDDSTVNVCGSYRGSYGTWEWDSDALRGLSKSNLYELYKLCK